MATRTNFQVPAATGAGNAALMPSFINIAIINVSSVLNDVDVKKAVDALQIQVTRDFAPAWGVNANLSFYKRSAAIPKGFWQIALLDNSDQAGALGYHDLTADGLPLGKVFAKADLQYGASWSVTLSHEILEMLIDPDINLTAFIQTTNTPGRLYAYEVCDACEADNFGYKINGVLVSDFVYPAWFESFRKPNSTKFDHMGKIKRPFDLLPGGYISIFDVTGGTGWQQVQAQSTPMLYQARPKVGSRRERRRVAREEWIPSKHPKTAAAFTNKRQLEFA